MIKKALQASTEKGIKVLEESTKAAGRKVGWDATIAQTVKKILKLRRY